jgi:CDP-glycerol glycerophosphotransferase
MMPELLDVLRFHKTRELDRTRDVRRGRRTYANLPYFEDPVRKIPRRLYRIDRELRMRRAVDDVRWEGSRLVVDGHAYLNRVDMIDPADSTIRLTLEAKRNPVLELPVERVARPDVTAAARTTVFDYTWSGFRTSVDVADLLPEHRRAKNTVWKLVAELRAGGRHATRRITVATPGRPQRPELLTVRDTRVVPTTRSGRFGIHVDKMPVVIDAWRADGDVLQLEGTVRNRDVPDLQPFAATLVLERETESGLLTYPVSLTPAGEGRWALLARLPLTGLADALEVGDQASHAEDYGDGLVWTVSLRPGRGLEPVPAVAVDDLADFRLQLDGREVLLGTTRTGRLTVIERGLRAVATGIRWTDDHALEIVGTYPADDEHRLGLVVSADGLVEEHVFPVRRDGSRFCATVPVRAVPTLAGDLPLPAGTWSLEMRKSNGGVSTAPLKIGRDVRPILPLAHTAGRRDLVLRYSDFDSVRLEVGPDLLSDEVGGFNQNRLQTIEFPAFVRQGLRDAVLFESYGAVQYADSPRAIAEELRRRDTRLDLLWAVSDEQTELPDGLRAVPRDSREWYEATARSRYVVTCVYRPMTGWLRPHPDQVVLQTWHGPPFKKIGFDSERIEQQARRGYHDRLRLETSRWSYLISPNPAATPILRSAFHYDGTVLETGYPRTDIFFRPDRDEIAARVRARLGLPEGKKVVLYAPTFRDNQQYRRNKFRLDMHLDLRHAQEVLGDDHVLLVRRHAKIVDSVRDAGSGFVRDVSRYPDVNELLLVTDVLVSDYSSLMFDFANTGRPMVFFAYDLEQYRDEIRGFYFDLDIVPGPLLRTSPEVIAAVANAGDMREKYDGAYRSFRDQFCAFDDGTASAQVVDAVFGADAGRSD